MGAMGERPPIWRYNSRTCGARRPAADLAINPAQVRAAPPRRPAGEPAPRRAAQRQADEERIAEEVDEVRLDALERVGPAQVEHEHARVWLRGAGPKRDHPPRC